MVQSMLFANDVHPYGGLIGHLPDLCSKCIWLLTGIKSLRVLEPFYKGKEIRKTRSRIISTIVITTGSVFHLEQEVKRVVLCLWLGPKQISSGGLLYPLHH
jgi:hypothetical protein